MARRKLIIANWKLNPNNKINAINLASNILSLLENAYLVDVCIIPPQIYIPVVSTIVERTNIAIGSQNCHYESSGAYTGEVSVDSLIDFGVKYILCGHSERRVLFQETDEIINKKVKKVVESGLTAVLCVGESLEENELGLVEQVCSTQIKRGLQNITNDKISHVVIAYEPVWAIGTGRVCNPDDAENAIRNIRTVVNGIYGEETGRNMQILYGGSVSATNVENIMSKNIDGCLVGGASINAESFANIVKNSYLSPLVL